MYYKFEDTKGVVRCRKLEEIQTIQWSKEKKTIRQTMADKILHRD
jgi:hypothetical protein